MLSKSHQEGFPYQNNQGYSQISQRSINQKYSERGGGGGEKGGGEDHCKYQ